LFFLHCNFSREVTM